MPNLYCCDDYVGACVAIHGLSKGGMPVKSNGRAVAVNPNGSLLQACGSVTHVLNLSFNSLTRLTLGGCRHPGGGCGA